MFCLRSFACQPKPSCLPALSPPCKVWTGAKYDLVAGKSMSDPGHRNLEFELLRAEPKPVQRARKRRKWRLLGGYPRFFDLSEWLSTTFSTAYATDIRRFQGACELERRQARGDTAGTYNRSQ
ncbi:hypothetical protein HYQ46_013105 [Verticillium longisporum]|nr:hypothetical protein HYQ46_013105 [Verticillium longisporum]